MPREERHHATPAPATAQELEAHARHHFEMAQSYGQATDADRYWSNGHMGQCIHSISEINKTAATGLKPFVSRTADYAAWFARNDAKTPA